MNGEEAFFGTSSDSHSSEALSDYLLSFSSEQRDLALSLCAYAIAAVDRAGLAERTPVERLHSASHASQAALFVLELCHDLELEARLKIRPHLIELFKHAQCLALERLPVIDDMLNFSDRRNELDLVATLSNMIEHIAKCEHLAFEDRDAMTEPLEEFARSASQLARMVLEPARYEFEWVDEFCMQVAYKAQSIAMGITWTLQTLYQTLRSERAAQQ